MAIFWGDNSRGEKKATTSPCFRGISLDVLERVPENMIGFTYLVLREKEKKNKTNHIVYNLRKLCLSDSVCFLRAILRSLFDDQQSWNTIYIYPIMGLQWNILRVQMDNKWIYKIVNKQNWGRCTVRNIQQWGIHFYTTTKMWISKQWR